MGCNLSREEEQQAKQKVELASNFIQNQVEETVNDQQLVEARNQVRQGLIENIMRFYSWISNPALHAKFQRTGETVENVLNKIDGLANQLNQNMLNYSVYVYEFTRKDQSLKQAKIEVSDDLQDIKQKIQEQLGFMPAQVFQLIEKQDETLLIEVQNRIQFLPQSLFVCLNSKSSDNLLQFLKGSLGEIKGEAICQALDSRGIKSLWDFFTIIVCNKGMYKESVLKELNMNILDLHLIKRKL